MEERLNLLQSKLEADPSLAEKLFGMETAAEVQSFLKEMAIEFSIAEIKELRDELVELLEKSRNGELSDEDLEEVAGGCVGVAIILFAISSLAVAAGIRNGTTQGKW